MAFVYSIRYCFVNVFIAYKVANRRYRLLSHCIIIMLFLSIIIFYATHTDIYILHTFFALHRRGSEEDAKNAILFLIYP